MGEVRQCASESIEKENHPNSNRESHEFSNLVVGRRSAIGVKSWASGLILAPKLVCLRGVHKRVTTSPNDTEIPECVSCGGPHDSISRHCRVLFPVTRA